MFLSSCTLRDETRKIGHLKGFDIKISLYTVLIDVVAYVKV